MCLSADEIVIYSTFNSLCFSDELFPRQQPIKYKHPGSAL